MNEELLAAVKEWAEACKVWDDYYAPTDAEMKRCNEAAKRLRALADKLP